MRKALLDAGYEVTSAEMTMSTKTFPMHLEGAEAIQVLKLLDRLEDLDDVQKVYSNAEFPDDVLATYGG
ncbi:MAG: YebC/PmpR family DNA-binding transcriptional regulator [Dehalococcoidia bacterium]